MSNDGFFWAGMAGKRQEQIQQLNRSIDKWEAHVANLEHTIEELRRSRLFWFNTAVKEGATAQVVADIFKEHNGNSINDTFGEKNVSRRIEDQKGTERKHTFLKYWDPTL